ncbi:MAG TPA: hypothetical protein VH619_06630 [Verrucomicrobiae bacterium]|jgi:hypothetical protein|nr:hypothetical protein [Verrucomicrobiae bacterium]
MTPTESRKRLLIAESELNRAQLGHEWRAMADNVHTLTGRARTTGSLVLGAASLITGLAAFRRIKTAPAERKVPWWRALLKGAQLATSLWLDHNSRPKS